MPPIEDHDLRYKLANELHARPFPNLESPGTVAFLAVKKPVDAASRDRSLDRRHLLELLDRHGAAHPAPDATHHYVDLGPFWLKWEQHSEFVTYSVFSAGNGERAFDPAEFDVFPEDWLQAAPGVRLTSVLIRVERDTPAKSIATKVVQWFVAESVAVARVLDDTAIIAGDFRIDPAGHIRFAVFVPRTCGSRRIGRIVQRLCEIETYKTMSMLGLEKARGFAQQINAIDADLGQVMQAMTDVDAKPEDSLDRILAMSAELENIQAQTAFRLAATDAYKAIVGQRIEVLREQRFQGRQMFGEFMMRRYDPAMRTIAATERRLLAISDRAVRAAQLLRTKVDVARQAQNQTVLESMDKRADLQLRLQRTVEGLSVVAISYYAINLALYVFGHFPAMAGMSKTGFASIVAPIVIVAVYLTVRRIRKHAQ